MQSKTVKNSLFKFNDNIIKCSISENIDEAKKEWGFIIEEKSDISRTCICQHKIKKVNFFFNKNNGSIICCGSVCCNKFNFEKNDITNKTLKQLFNLKNNKFCSYDNITNIKDYIENSKIQLINFLNDKIKSSNFEDLKEIFNDLQNIRLLYNIDFFDEFIISIKKNLSDKVPIYIEKKLYDNIYSLVIIVPEIQKIINDYSLEIFLQNFNTIEFCKLTITKLVDGRIYNYSVDTTVPLRDKMKKMLTSPKLLYIQEFLNTEFTKLDDKINSIRAQNFARDKLAYERRIEREKRMEEKNYKKKYF